ncbi:MAG TPA: cytochrome c oxidase assembly factor Coa1 family protein [Arenimonas sp.]
MKTGSSDSQWLERNIKWVLLLGVLGTAMMVAAAFASIAYMVMAAFRASDPYVHSLSAARGSEVVVAALGDPIHEGWLTTGSITSSSTSGTASLAIPIAGPRGSATIYVEARKSAGAWKYRDLLVELKPGGERIDLLAADE